MVAQDSCVEGQSRNRETLSIIKARSLQPIIAQIWTLHCVNTFNICINFIKSVSIAVKLSAPLFSSEILLLHIFVGFTLKSWKDPIMVPMTRLCVEMCLSLVTLLASMKMVQPFRRKHSQILPLWEIEQFLGRTNGLSVGKTMGVFTRQRCVDVCWRQWSSKAQGQKIILWHY